MAEDILFFGRFHPVVLHLPIGMLVLLAIYVVAAKQIDYGLLKKGLWISLVSSAITIIFGLILATEGGYDNSTLIRHKYLGFALFGLQLIMLIALTRPFPLKSIKALFVFAMVILTSTGHQGANLTHGDNYLFEHMSFTRLSTDSRWEVEDKITHIDSALIFSQIIYPIFKTNCISCHGQKTQKGNLRLSSFETIMKGGKHGPPVLPGEPDLSELLRRIRLPENHLAVMPPKGKQPLTTNEIAIIEWWIKTGAKDSVMISTLADYGRMKVLIEGVTGARTVEAFRVNAPDLDSVQLLIASEDGWDVRLLSEGSNALRVKAERPEADVLSLMNIAAHIYELDLSEKTIDERMGNLLGKCTHLSILNLSACKNVEKALLCVSKDNLTTLNLNQSDLSQLDLISEFDRLKRLYLLDTQADKNQISDFSSKHPDVHMISERFMFDKDNI